MNFGRLPFQFNPAERQAEIRKRFGSKPCDMHIDFRNSYNMGAGNRETNSASSSPRLQHRVPVFIEEPNTGISGKFQSNNVDSGKKPKVRVVPIEIERDLKPARHRAFSGPAGVRQNYIEDRLFANDTKPFQHPSQNMTLPNKKRVPSGETKPCVYNIPISIEKSNNYKNTNNDFIKKPDLNSSSENGKITNDFNSTTSNTDVKVPEKETDVSLQLNKVSNILKELKSYETEVAEFSGAANDKQYRYLDEMLTRLMLRLDDIETMSNAEVRNARKAAIKEVQSYIDLLETKICPSSKENDVMMSESQEIESVLDEEFNEDKLIESSVTEEVSNMPYSTNDSLENDKSEVEEVDKTEVIENNKTKVDLKDYLSCPVNVSKDFQVDMEYQKESYEVPSNAAIKNPELSHDTESNMSKSLLPVETDFVHDFDPTKSCDSDMVTNDTSDIDMAELSETPKMDIINGNNETCAENSLEYNCDILMNKDNLESAFNNLETVTPNITSNSYIPENASNNEMELLESSSLVENSTKMLPCDKSHTVTILNLDSQPLNLNATEPNVQLANSSEDSSNFEIEPTFIKN